MAFTALAAACCDANHLSGEAYDFVTKTQHETSSSICRDALSRVGAARHSLVRGSYREAEATFSQILSACKTPPASPALVAEALSGLGAALYSEAKYRQAEAVFGRALDLRRNISGPTSPEMIEAASNLAAALEAQGKYKEAEGLDASILGAIDREHVPGSPVVSKLLGNFAAVEDDLGKYVSAERLVRRGLAMLDRAGAGQPETLDPALPGLLIVLAHVQQQRGDLAGSERTDLRCLAIQEKLVGASNPQVAITLNNLAALYVAQYRYKDAVPILKRSLDITLKTVGPADPRYAEILGNLALVARKRHQLQEAEEQFRQAIDISERALGPNHQKVAVLLNNLAELYLEEKRYREATPLLERAISIYEQPGFNAQPDFSSALQNLAIAREAAHDYSGAAKLFRRAIAIDENAVGAESSRVAADLDNEAVNLFRMHRRADAESELLHAISICEHRSDAAAPLAESLDNLAQVYWVEKRYAESEPLLRRAIPIFDRLLGPDDPRLVAPLELYSAVMRKLQKYAEAEQAEVRATRIRVKNAIREG